MSAVQSPVARATVSEATSGSIPVDVASRPRRASKRSNQLSSRQIIVSPSGEIQDGSMLDCTPAVTSTRCGYRSADNCTLSSTASHEISKPQSSAVAIRVCFTTQDVFTRVCICLATYPAKAPGLSGRTHLVEHTPTDVFVTHARPSDRHNTHTIKICFPRLHAIADAKLGKRIKLALV